MNKYEFCEACNCAAFKEKRQKLLCNVDSVIDAAVELNEFVDKCCKSCKLYEEAVEKGAIDG